MAYPPNHTLPAPLAITKNLYSPVCRTLENGRKRLTEWQPMNASCEP